MVNSSSTFVSAEPENLLLDVDENPIPKVLFKLFTLLLVPEDAPAGDVNIPPLNADLFDFERSLSFVESFVNVSSIRI